MQILGRRGAGRTGRLSLGLLGGVLAILPVASWGEEKKADGPVKMSAEAQRKADKATEDAAKQRLAEFRKALKDARTPDAFAQAVRTLDVKHPLVLNQLVQILDAQAEEIVHVAVVETLVKIDDPRCVPVLNTLLLNKLEHEKENRAVCIALVKAVGYFGDPRAAPALAKAVECDDPSVAGAACEASPKVKDPVVIDALISLLKKAEQPDSVYYPSGGGRSGSGWQGGQTVVNSHKAMREPASKALQAITGLKLNSARDWNQWWRANRATWRPA
jgi:HEAT repeat protein